VVVLLLQDIHHTDGRQGLVARCTSEMSSQVLHKWTTERQVRACRSSAVSGTTKCAAAHVFKASAEVGVLPRPVPLLHEAAGHGTIACYHVDITCSLLWCSIHERMQPFCAGCRAQPTWCPHAGCFGPSGTPPTWCYQEPLAPMQVNVADKLLRCIFIFASEDDQKHVWSDRTPSDKIQGCRRMWLSCLSKFSMVYCTMLTCV
jgi:hypothetical protein